MKRLPQRSTPALLNQRLNLYALAAGAAGVSLLALAQPAEAEVIFTPTHFVIGVGGIHSYDLDIDGDGVTDFAINAAHRCNTDQCFYNLFDRVPPGNGIVGSARGGGWSPEAAVLKRGTPIGPSQRFFGKVVSMASFYFGGGGSSANGNWANVSNRFLGLSFKINGETHYGWARLSVKDAHLQITAVLTGYAYETVANQPIKAGQTSGTDVGLTAPDTADPTHGTLGALALGSIKPPRRARTNQ
jgi:hypothetical protein